MYRCQGGAWKQPLAFFSPFCPIVSKVVFVATNVEASSQNFSPFFWTLSYKNCTCNIPYVTILRSKLTHWWSGIRRRYVITASFFAHSWQWFVAKIVVPFAAKFINSEFAAMLVASIWLCIIEAIKLSA